MGELVPGEGKLNAVLDLAVVGLAFLAIYLGLARLLRISEVTDVMRLVTRRLSRKQVTRDRLGRARASAALRWVRGRRRGTHLLGRTVDDSPDDCPDQQARRTGPRAAQTPETPREVSDVTTGSIGPGTVLADRYRLDDLLTESAGARFWRATDTILARSVAIHAVPSDDPRAPGLLEAARVSATVTDPHLLRVLDCDDDDGITWVVNEWGDGISLDLMLQQGTLPPSRAAWLTREVAEAIAAGHAQGVAHGRLNPEAVLVTHAGAVKLIGYVVDASPRESPAPRTRCTASSTTARPT